MNQLVLPEIPDPELSFSGVRGSSVLLKVPPGMIPVIPVTFSKTLKVRFPKIRFKELLVNRWYYGRFGDEKRDGSKTPSVFLVRAVKWDTEGVWFQHVEGTPPSSGLVPKKQFSPTLVRPGSPFRFFSIPSLDAGELELSRLSDTFFSDLLYKDTSLFKALGDKDLRVKVLVRAIQMSLNEFGHD